jgi:hypothetical protein
VDDTEIQDSQYSLMKVIFRPEAEDELIEVIDWYEARSPGLGAELLRCVDACVDPT